MTRVDPPVPLVRVVEILRRSGTLLESRAPEDLSVTGVTHDSRRVEEGALFLAWRGTKADGHEFLGEVREAGAAAAVVERLVTHVELPQILVRDGRRAAALAAHEVLDRPSDSLRVTAVTGTNGKTTVAFLARHLLGRREPTAALGTLGTVDRSGEVVPGSGGLTTPGPVEVAERLRDLVSDGMGGVVLEASSHALEQRRLDGVQVDAACFTNLTRDHLDYHGDVESYRAAKARLLGLLRGPGSGVVLNGDDPAWSALPAGARRLLVTRVIPPMSEGLPEFHAPPAEERLPDLHLSIREMTGAGSRLRLEWGDAACDAELPLLGTFNVENAGVALGAALLAGMTLEEAAVVLADAPTPPGRLEITVTEPVPVILDYAHTPDALRRVLAALRPLYPGRLIVVFGAGGDRDRSKRPEMGRVVAQGADVPVVTSDNPRTEDPDRIVGEIVEGMGSTPHHRVTDRRQAIELALELARPGDAVLLAGKGHEDYQVLGTEKRPFDERRVVREILSGKEAP